MISVIALSTLEGNCSRFARSFAFEGKTENIFEPALIDREEGHQTELGELLHLVFPIGFYAGPFEVGTPKTTSRQKALIENLNRGRRMAGTETGHLPAQVPHCRNGRSYEVIELGDLFVSIARTSGSEQEFDGVPILRSFLDLVSGKEFSVSHHQPFGLEQ